MKNQPKRKRLEPDAAMAMRARRATARGPRAASAPAQHALRLEQGGLSGPDQRRDPLAYRAAPSSGAPGPRPVRPAAERNPRTGRRNRRRIPPVVRWNRRLRSAARLLVFALLFEIVWLGFTSPLLRVEKVDITGATVRTPAQIERLAGLDKRGNIFRAPLDKATAALAVLPEVKSVTIERQLPRTLAVSIQERPVLASVAMFGNWWALDADGVLFRKMNVPVAGRPMLRAPVSGKPVLGTKLKMPAVDAALKLLTMTAGLPAGKTVSLNVDARNEAWLNYASGLKIRLGALDDAPERLAVTERLLKGPNGPEILKKVLVLDVATPDNEVYKRRENSDAFRLTGSAR